MLEAQVDTIYNGAGYGPVAQRLLANGMRPQALRTNAVLQYDEWKAIDDTVLEVARVRLNGVADLVSRGLVYNIADGMGSTVLQYQDSSDMTAAQVSMSPYVRGNKDRPEYDTKYLPLPIVYKDFGIDIRQLTSSRKLGQPLDTSMAATAGKLVAEKIEDILFNGLGSYSSGGGTIYGYTDFPGAITFSMGTNWAASGVTGETIVTKVSQMKQESLDSRHYGPWMLYISPDLEAKFDLDFKANGELTIRERVLRIDGIQAVKVADQLPSGYAVLVEMMPDVARIVIGMTPTTVQWEEMGGLYLDFKVMAIMVPQLRTDQEEHSGIVVAH